MSTYPGENPQTPDGEQPASGTEETQPVGYWERQAAEQAREQEQQGHPDPTTPYPQAPSGAVFNPTSGQPFPGYEPEGSPSASPEAPPASPGQHPYGQMPGVNPYGPYAPGAQGPGGQGPGYQGPGAQGPGYQGYARPAPTRSPVSPPPTPTHPARAGSRVPTAWRRPRRRTRSRPSRWCWG